MGSKTENEDTLDPQLLYRPVEQLPQAPAFKISYPMVTPSMADNWLRRSDAVTEFSNRATRTGDVRRWKLLMETDRFVQWLPDGPILFDDKDCLLNGKHRLTALSGQKKSFGMMVVKGVPRWMMAFFDTGRCRTLNDLFAIGNRASKSQTGSAARLAMRYEEMIFGVRPQLNWKAWPQHRDEFTDVDTYVARRTPLMDLYTSADQLYRGSRLLVPSALVFRFFQELAWPDGAEQIMRFWQGLNKGSLLEAGDPALTLREWSKDVWATKDRIPAKRETHLLLLLRMFAASMMKTKVNRVQYGYGLTMPYPYHPDGLDIAVRNVKVGIATIDAEYELNKVPSAIKPGESSPGIPQVIWEASAV